MRKNNSLHIALEAVLRQKLDGLLQRGVHVEGTADGARLRAVVRRFKGAVIGGAEALVVVQLRAKYGFGWMSRLLQARMGAKMKSSLRLKQV